MNIYEIAKQSGLSTTTVSRVINGSPNVSEETRKKVLNVIDELGFVPNFFARGLNMKRTRTVGIVCPVITDMNSILFCVAWKRIMKIWTGILIC